MPKPNVKETRAMVRVYEDTGYTLYCPHCGCRHGEMVTGVRDLTSRACSGESCQKKESRKAIVIFGKGSEP